MSMDACDGGIQSFPRLESSRSVSFFGVLQCCGLRLCNFRAGTFLILLRRKGVMLHAAVGVLDIATPSVVLVHFLDSPTI